MTGPLPGPGADPVAPYPPNPPAPEPPDPTPEPEPAPPEPTPAPETATPPGGRAPGDGGVIDIPSGWDLLVSAAEGAVESFTSGVAAFVDLFHYHLLTLPASGQATDPATWAPPSDPFWQAAFVVYSMLAVFVLPLVWALGWFNVAHPRGVRRRERLKSFAIAFVGIVAGWMLLQGWFHFWNAAALGFAPSGDAFMATPGSASKLGVGLVLGLVLLVTKAVVILVGLGIHLLFVFLTFMFVALWPLSVALYASDVFALDAMGTAGIAGTLVLGPLQFVKALILRLIFEFPLSVTDPETVTTFVLIVIGVALAFLVVPWVGLKRLLPRSIVAAGHRAHRETDTGALRERAPPAAALRERVEAVSADARSRLAQRAPSRGEAHPQTRVRDSEGRAPTYKQSDWRTNHTDTDTRTRTRND